MKKRTLLTYALSAAALAGALAPATSMANAWPERAVKLVVPFPPGGSTDAVARMVAQALTESLGQPVVIDNKPGAGGTIGANHVATAKADGYTLGIATSSTHPAAVVLQKNLPYDPVQDFAPVTEIGNTAFIMVGTPGSPQSDFSSFIENARANPGTVPFANVGTSTMSYLLTLQLEKLTGVQFLHVSYKGSGQAYPEIMAGRVATLFDNPGTSTELVKSGKLINYGLTTPTAALPAAPLLSKVGAKYGLENFNSSFWYGLVAPAGTPADVVARIRGDLLKFASSPAGKDAFNRLSLKSVVSTPADFKKTIADDAEFFKGLVKELKLPE